MEFRDGLWPQNSLSLHFSGGEIGTLLNFLFSFANLISGCLNRPRSTTIHLYCGSVASRYAKITEVTPCHFEISLETPHACSITKDKIGLNRSEKGVTKRNVGLNLTKNSKNENARKSDKAFEDHSADETRQKCHLLTPRGVLEMERMYFDVLSDQVGKLLLSLLSFSHAHSLLLPKLIFFSIYLYRSTIFGAFAGPSLPPSLLLLSLHSLSLSLLLNVRKILQYVKRHPGEKREVVEIGRQSINGTVEVTSFFLSLHLCFHIYLYFTLLVYFNFLYRSL